MTARIIWLCHAPTRAMRDGAFPSLGDDLDDPGLQKAKAMADRRIRHDLAVTSPAPAAQQTAQAIGLNTAAAEPALSDIDHGRWSGQSFTAVHAVEPELLAAWMADPSATTPGGEALCDVARRVGGWMDAQSQGGARILAVTHPTIIRVAIALTLQCPIKCVFNIDIAPLSTTTTSFNGRWRLQEVSSRANLNWSGTD